MRRQQLPAGGHVTLWFLWMEKGGKNIESRLSSPMITNKLSGCKGKIVRLCCIVRRVNAFGMDQPQ